VPGSRAPQHCPKAAGPERRVRLPTRASTARRSMRRRSALLLMMGAACRRLCLQLTAKGGRHSHTKVTATSHEVYVATLRGAGGPAALSSAFLRFRRWPCTPVRAQAGSGAFLACQQDQRWCLTPSTSALKAAGPCTPPATRFSLLGRWAAPSLAYSSCAPAQVTSNRPQWGGQALSREHGAVRSSISGTRLFAAPSRHQS